MKVLIEAALIITAEPERHHICEVAMAFQYSGEQMGTYQCQHDQQILHILGDKNKDHFIDCSPWKHPAAQIMAVQKQGEPSWSVICTDKDRILPDAKMPYRDINAR